MIKKMEYIYEIYLNKSFSKAAKKLFISQPSISAVVKKVETDLGLLIFDRSKKPIQLTQAGEYYIESIEKILKIQKNMESHFREILINKKTHLHIGAATFFCTYTLPQIIQNFERKYPHYRISLYEGNPNDLYKSLQLEKLDIIIEIEEKRLKSFNSFTWKKDYILLAVPSVLEINNKLKKYHLRFNDILNKEYIQDTYPSVDLKVFKNENFLLLKEENNMYKKGVKICENAGFTPKVSMYLDQMLTSYSLACEGKGIAFVRSEVTKYLKATDRLIFYKINDRQAFQNIMLFYNKSNTLSKISNDFIKFIK